MSEVGKNLPQLLGLTKNTFYEPWTETTEAAGATLLGLRLFWTERRLLTLVRQLYRRRLQQLSGVLSDQGFPETAAAVREAMLAVMAEAALGGHGLGAWEPVDNGYQARCSKCSMTSWIGHGGVRYSLLEDECPSKP